MQIDNDAASAVQSELTSGEHLIWAGRPKSGMIFHKDDLYLVPFSLLWGGFAVFWEANVAGLWGHDSKAGTSWTFGVIWGIPFVIIGQYLIWGRFIYAAWKKQRTFYAVTNRRVIVVQGLLNRKMASVYIDRLPALVKERGRGTIGTLRFTASESVWSQRRGWGTWDGMAVGTTPVFVDVEDVDALYRMIAELREKGRIAASFDPSARSTD